MAAHGKNISEITDSTFAGTVLQSTTPFLLDFSAEWCQPCKAIAPLFTELAAQYDGKVAFGTVDIDANPKTPAQFQVRSIPTLLLFKGGKVVGQLTGAHPKNRIEDLLKKAI